MGREYGTVGGGREHQCSGGKEAGEEGVGDRKGDCFNNKRTKTDSQLLWMVRSKAPGAQDADGGEGSSMEKQPSRKSRSGASEAERDVKDHVKDVFQRQGHADGVHIVYDDDAGADEAGRGSASGRKSGAGDGWQSGRGGAGDAAEGRWVAGGETGTESGTAGETETETESEVERDQCRRGDGEIAR